MLTFIVTTDQFCLGQDTLRKGEQQSVFARHPEARSTAISYTIAEEEVNVALKIGQGASVPVFRFTTRLNVPEVEEGEEKKVVQPVTCHYALVKGNISLLFPVVMPVRPIIFFF